MIAAVLAQLADVMIVGFGLGYIVTEVIIAVRSKGGRR